MGTEKITKAIKGVTMKGCMRGSIVSGTLVCQDTRFNLEVKHGGDGLPPLIMDIYKKGGFYVCTGPGFGDSLGRRYGNGPVLVRSIDDLIIFKELR